MATRGFLVCGDITGYTAYLSASELEHASGILGELLRLLLGEVQAPLHLSRVEGDAVISYAPPGDGFQGQLVVDRLDDTYVAFRRAMGQMVLNTSCACQACANIGSLDLKFLIHHGEFAVQKIGLQDELVGAEVNQLFRLTKNTIRQSLGLPGYMAFTVEAVAALGLAGFADGLIVHTENDTERGSVMLHVRDMAPVWAERKNLQAFSIPDNEVLLRDERTVPVPLEEAFGYLTRPETRVQMFHADSMEVERNADGRIGLNAVYVCAHGDARIPNTVIDWAPPTRYAFSSPIPGGFTIVGQFLLEPAGDGTRIDCVIGMARGIKTTFARPKVRKEMQEFSDGLFATLDELIAAGASGA